MKHLITINKPQDIYLVGSFCEDNSLKNIKIHDDFAEVAIRNDKNNVSLEIDGFVNILTKEGLLKNKETLLEDGVETCDLLLLPNFQGEIYLRVVDGNENDITPKKLNLDDYVYHQITADVEIVIPNGITIGEVVNIHEFIENNFDDDYDDGDNDINLDEEDSEDELELVETTHTTNTPSIDNLNDQIKVMNNGRGNITANPLKGDLDLGDELGEDSTFNEFSTRLNNFHTNVVENLAKENENIKTMNATIDRGDYWAIYYKIDLYNSIVSSFFDREYLTHPQKRLERIQNFLEERIFQYKPYLEEIHYQIKTSEHIEAFEKEWLCKTLLEEFFPVSRNEISKKEQAVNELVDFKKAGTEIKEETKSKLNDFLRKVDSGEITENTKVEGEKKELSEFEKADIKGRITILYDKVSKKAVELDGEEDGIITTYINSLYNPQTTKLDDKNLLLNLNILSRMQDFGVMKWEFDEKKVKASNKEINLTHDWWDKELAKDLETDLKYANIVEKDLNVAFYGSLLVQLLNNADQTTFTEAAYKIKKVLDNSEGGTKETSFLNTVLKKTQPGSILFLTPDMEQYVQVDKEVNEELGDRGQIKYLGEWDKRHVYVLNPDKFSLKLKGYSKEVIFMNRGNSYLLLPDKPIVYFNVIENPFLERGILKWFAAAEFEISMDKAGRMSVDNTFFN